jgi:hypothetical protein
LATLETNDVHCTAVELLHLDLGKTLRASTHVGVEQTEASMVMHAAASVMWESILVPYIRKHSAAQSTLKDTWFRILNSLICMFRHVQYQLHA